jgi:hypothetical protein
MDPYVCLDETPAFCVVLDTRILNVFQQIFSGFCLSVAADALFVSSHTR